VARSSPSPRCRACAIPVVGRERCDLSGEEIDEEYVHNGDELAYCPGCESSDVLTIDGGSLTYAEHDRRGRPLSA
jgi:Zn finger protein HypA/HybF involved in hydrogenase expression